MQKPGTDGNSMSCIKSLLVPWIATTSQQHELPPRREYDPKSQKQKINLMPGFTPQHKAHTSFSRTSKKEDLDKLSRDGTNGIFRVDCGFQHWSTCLTHS